MKNTQFLIIGLLSLSSVTGYCIDTPVKQKEPSSSSTLNIACSPELTELTSTWVSEYGKLNPTVKIDVNTLADMQVSGNGLSFVSSARPVNNEWKMVVGREAIVPVINSKNPLMDVLQEQGVSPEEFRQILTDGQSQDWGIILKTGKTLPMHFYMIEDEAMNSSIAGFIKGEPGMITGIVVANAQELIKAVQNDIYAMGFTRLPDLRFESTNGMMENISLLPIDKNNNGRLDHFENIYANLEAFTRGVWVGKYPSSLSESIYAASSVKPTGSIELAFLTWVMTDGQQLLNSKGYSILASNLSQSNVDQLTGTEIALADSEKTSTSQTWLLIAIGLVVAGLAIRTIWWLVQQWNSEALEIHITSELDENKVDAPKGLYYDRSHTWAIMEKDGNVRVGVDDFLQHVTGTLTRVKMKEPGESIRKGEKILTIIKDGKQLSLYAPVSGIIRENNQALVADSSLMHSSPYGNGWVYMIEPKNWPREIEFMLMGDKYKEWLRNEFARLREFFVASINNNGFDHVVIQDGGEVRDNILAELEPEVWEEFQTKFIDISK